MVDNIANSVSIMMGPTLLRATQASVALSVMKQATVAPGAALLKLIDAAAIANPPHLGQRIDLRV
jgi:hypothetical protein